MGGWADMSGWIGACDERTAGPDEVWTTDVGVGKSGVGAECGIR